MKKKLYNLSIVALLALSLSACAQTKLATHYAKKLDLPGQVTDEGTYKIGKPYKIAGRWIEPKEDFYLTQTGYASWYGPGFHGRRTANGEIFDPNELTAAHRTLQMPSFVRVTNLENGRSVVVRVNDRGPFKDNRVIDVSKRAAEILGFINQGTAKVKIQVLSNESKQIAAAAREGQDTSRITYAARRPVLNADHLEGQALNYQKASYETEQKSDLPESLRKIYTDLNNLNDNQKQSFQKPSQQKQSEAQIPSSGGQYYVLAGAFSVHENATRLQQKLSKIGAVKIEEIFSQNKKLYRVKVGPYITETAAKEALDLAQRSGNPSARIIK